MDFSDQKPSNIIKILKTMMSLSNSEWYYEKTNDNQIIALDYIIYNKKDIHIKTYDILVKLLSMTRKEWNKEKTWKRRARMICLRKMIRNKNGLGM